MARAPSTRPRRRAALAVRRSAATKNAPGSVRAKMSASDDGPTAAEAVAAILVERLGVQREQDRVKMSIGYLIRQVMERHGCRLDRKGQICQPNQL